MMKKYKVGVFEVAPRKDGKRRYAAYTKWYSPEWGGCIEVKVEAESGQAAKKRAIEVVQANE